MKQAVNKTNARYGEQTQFANLAPATVTKCDSPLPVLIENSGSAAQFAWEEFIYGKIRNPHTRAAYERAIRQFLSHCHALDKQLPTVSPRDVGSYLDQRDYAPATKKLHLSAIRHFFDTLVTRHVVVLNPAHSVRSERLQVVEGKTPEITVPQARRLMWSLNKTHVVELRDRAIIAIMIYTAARVGAVASLRRGDFYDLGDQYCLRFAEKGGKSQEIPVRHDLQKFIFDYLTEGGMEYADKSKPLFRTTIRKTKKLTQNAMTAGDMARMVKRRLRKASLPARLSPHSFRVATITDLLSQGVPLEVVQNLAGHADPRTTRLYDRRQHKVTRNIVERISI
ncbi:tyrosine-type recombinase/integrase [Planctomycetes bacterium TBK1r]|uniref:Tyrosine recombinase XerD n=1 Tax=Stieleria magnilauensis TaxID=2527963 RepID=A0ABX5XPP2_9BACT|nr:Tyrosine recombinase XerD [Planctomycetes bacterium TBK1r]